MSHRPSSTEFAARDCFVEEGLPALHEWPQFIASPDASIHSHGNFTCAVLDAQITRGRGDAAALMFFDEGRYVELSYRELAGKVAQLAHVLVGEMKLRPGQRVLLRGPNNLMMAIGWLAVLRAGGVAVTTMPLLRSQELQQILGKAQIEMALCDARFGAELQACRSQLHAEGDTSLLSDTLFFNTDETTGAESRMAGQSVHFNAYPARADDPALIAFTSGTTGSPKGTVHFHRDLFAICEAFPRHVLGLRPSDRCCGSSPLGFTFGLGGLLCFPLYWGATGILAEQLTADDLLDLIERCGATVLFTVPTLYRQMLPLMRDGQLASLRISVSAGEALPVTTRSAWRAATALEMIDGLGCTEMLHVFIANTADRYRDGAIGKAVPGYEIAVLDELMQPLPPGRRGRLAVRGVTGCRYLRDERQRAYVRQGWNLSGDVGYLDEDGYFYFVGRSDDLIVSAGYNISHAEVEDALLCYPVVAECAVIGAPDPDRGHIVQAHVVLRFGLTGDAALARELQEHVKRMLAPYKYPRSIVFCEQLPRTQSGKLQRFRLRDVS